MLRADEHPLEVGELLSPERPEVDRPDVQVRPAEHAAVLRHRAGQREPPLVTIGAVLRQRITRVGKFLGEELLRLGGKLVVVAVDPDFVGGKRAHCAGLPNRRTSPGAPAPFRSRT